MRDKAWLSCIPEGHRFPLPLQKCHRDPLALPALAGCCLCIHPCVVHTCICPCPRVCPSMHRAPVHTGISPCICASIPPSTRGPHELQPLVEVPEMHPGSCQLAGNSPGSPRSQGSTSWQEVWDAGIQPSPGQN